MNKLAAVICIVAIALEVIIPVMMELYWQAPANVQYGNLFGANVAMATQGATSLTGPDSIQYYLMQIWTQMNQTFTGYNYNQVFNQPWSWTHTYDNSLAKQNQYFESLNQTITYQQAWLNNVETGKVTVVSGNPMMQAINVTRAEMNVSGGLDWALNGAWYLTFTPLAYYTWMYIVIVDVILAVIAIFAGILAID